MCKTTRVGVTAMRNKVLKRLFFLFSILFLLLWTVKIYIHEKLDEKCNFPASHSGASLSAILDVEKGADLARDASKDPSKWLHNQLNSLNPIHFTSCPALNSSVTFSSASLGLLPRAQATDYFVTLSAIGELHLRLSGINDELVKEEEISSWLGNVSRLIGDTDAVLTSFSTSIRKSDNAHQILGGVKGLGRQLVVSLANIMISPQTNDKDGMTVTARALEGMGIEWLGLHAKKHHILVGRERVGLLAFCGVHRECGKTTDLPFGPVKYSLKVAKSAINELKEHGISLIVVLMYWGLETSDFPDETALTIARQLAMLRVGVIVGYHPTPILDHAYFGNTLVIFSLGKILSSERIAKYCWKKVSGDWQYSSAKICNMVHPGNRKNLRNKELQTRIYKIQLSRLHPAVAEYTTVRLEDHKPQGREYIVKRPVLPHVNYKWISACSNTDIHCLSCQQF